MSAFSNSTVPLTGALCAKTLAPAVIISTVIKANKINGLRNIISSDNPMATFRMPNRRKGFVFLHLFYLNHG